MDGSPDPFSPVGHLHPVRFRVQPKAQASAEQGVSGLSTADQEQPATQHSSQPQLAQPSSVDPQAEGTDVPGVPHPSSPHPSATSAADANVSGSRYGNQQQQQQQQRAASNAEAGRIIQVPSQLPRLPQSRAATSGPLHAEAAAQITSDLSLTHSSCGVHAVCRPRAPEQGEDAAASAALSGQALSHALQAISTGEQTLPSGTLSTSLYPSALAC